MNIGASSAFLGMNRSLEGMKRNSEGIARAGEAIAVVTASVLSAETPLPVDRVDVRGGTDLEEAVIDMKRSQHGYTANLRAAKASDEAFESMLDMVLPSTRDQS